MKKICGQRKSDERRKTTMKVKLSHLGLLVKDVKATKEFYCNCLGYEPLFEEEMNGESFIHYLKNADNEFLEIFDGAHGARNFPKQNVQHICYLVDDLTEVAEFFQNKGYTVYYLPSYSGKVAPKPFVPRLGGDNSCICFVVDPDGNEIEFMQYTKDSLQLKGANEKLSRDKQDEED